MGLRARGRSNTATVCLIASQLNPQRCVAPSKHLYNSPLSRPQHGQSDRSTLVFMFQTWALLLFKSCPSYLYCLRYCRHRQIQSMTKCIQMPTTFLNFIITLLILMLQVLKSLKEEIVMIIYIHVAHRVPPSFALIPVHAFDSWNIATQLQCCNTNSCSIALALTLQFWSIHPREGELGLHANFASFCRSLGAFKPLTASWFYRLLHYKFWQTPSLNKVWMNMHPRYPWIWLDDFGIF